MDQFVGTKTRWQQKLGFNNQLSPTWHLLSVSSTTIHNEIQNTKTLKDFWLPLMERPCPLMPLSHNEIQNAVSFHTFESGIAQLFESTTVWEPLRQGLFIILQSADWLFWGETHTTEHCLDVLGPNFWLGIPVHFYFGQATISCIPTTTLSSKRGMQHIILWCISLSRLPIC